MDKNDLQKLDPKRFGLEKDKIILETTKNALQAYLDLYPTKIEEDVGKLKNQTEKYKKEIIKYLIEQKKLLLRLVEHYQYEINKIMKEDIL
jgi:hypothetical protein